MSICDNCNLYKRLPGPPPVDLSRCGACGFLQEYRRNKAKIILVEKKHPAIVESIALAKWRGMAMGKTVENRKMLAYYRQVRQKAGTGIGIEALDEAHAFFVNTFAGGEFLLTEEQWTANPAYHRENGRIVDENGNEVALSLAHGATI